MPRQNAALSSATQHAMPPEIDRKLGTEYLNTNVSMYAGYSVKLIDILYRKGVQNANIFYKLSIKDILN